MIFYFSGTGNSRWAAHRLADQTGEETVFIPDVTDNNCCFTLRTDERLGFVFPVHGWRPPKLVRQFVSRLTVKMEKDTPEKPYTYMVCTAGDSIGRTMEIFRDDLSRRGWSLDAAFTLIMPESYVGLPMMDVDTKEKETAKLRQARKDLDIFAGNILHRVKAEKLVKGPIPCFFSGPVGGYFVHRLVTDRKFRVEEERCIRCGKCAEVCPVHDISGGKGLLPEWLHNGRCLTCFTCYHHCPRHAIEFGKQTRHKGQYFLTEQTITQVSEVKGELKGHATLNDNG